MKHTSHFRPQRLRRGTAAVEFAIVAPLLMFIFVVAVDFSRAFYNAQIVADCARIGALYAANPDLGDKTSAESVQEIILSAAKDLKPLPTIAVSTFKEATIPYVEVTVTQTFNLTCPLIVPSQYTLTRSARARLYPAALQEDE